MTQKQEIEVEKLLHCNKSKNQAEASKDQHLNLQSLQAHHDTPISRHRLYSSGFNFDKLQRNQHSNAPTPNQPHRINCTILDEDPAN